jgi:hypothetical protein
MVSGFATGIGRVLVGGVTWLAAGDANRVDSNNNPTERDRFINATPIDRGGQEDTVEAGSAIAQMHGLLPFVGGARHFIERHRVVSGGSLGGLSWDFMTTHRSRASLLAGAALILTASSPLLAQDVAPAESPEPVAQPVEPAAAEAPAPEPVDDMPGDESEEIVVTGSRLRGSVVGDIPPENVLTTRDIRATGATDVTEILEAIAPQIGSARGRGGERPVLLLNGKRISSFRELRDIPSEAIQRVEILPEEVALKYGYRADQRVVNFVLRERFRSTAVRVQGEVPTEGGNAGGLADVTRLMLGGDKRTTINLHAEGNSALTEAERDIAFQPIAGEAALDPRGARTLIGSKRDIRATITHNRPIGDISATLNGELEHSEGTSLLGFPFLADDQPVPVSLDPRGRDTATDSAHAGAVLSWDKSSWRYSVTGNADLSRSVTTSDPSALADVDFGEDSSRTTRASADLDGTANGKLFALPAGDASATFKVGASTLSQDSRRRRVGVDSDNSLSRSEANAAVNLDLPISRRNRDFSALGNLTLNANGGVEQLSDFGTLTTIGAGLNWSPASPVNFIASWTHEEGAPSVAQLGDPLLETPGSRIFDFTTGQTVLVTAVTGGNANLNSDRRNVFKLGANWKPLKDTDLRFRGEYVRTTINDPISGFPGPSAALEAAFPERFTRNLDGDLVRVDLRPVNFERSRRDTLRLGLDFSRPLKSKPPSAAQIAELRSRRQADSGEQQGGRPAAEGDSTAPAAQAGGRGFGRFGGRGGGGRGQRGRLQFSLTDTITLVDNVNIREGLPQLDFLHGDALGGSGGRPRHQVEARAGWSNNGLGARLSADWRSGTRVDTDQAGTLKFSPLATFNLRLFANPGDRFDLVSKHPWLRGTQVRLEVQNVFNAKQHVENAAGDVPINYQPDLLDPQGRAILISFRKLFSPPPSAFRRRPQAGE